MVFTRFYKILKNDYFIENIMYIESIIYIQIIHSRNSVHTDTYHNIVIIRAVERQNIFEKHLHE